ncbi:Formin-like protein [Seminavis robusta]|uniref:Formin-like protein n=1 Tax=Seminavis robusta TaxID=568900 RepID=A0A9N8HM27_9STRA|nr:Formin-like protein [Seminavis robusta]|eukprot:Sro964_g225470.1 Formin-like protein (2557) ;mRNA; r:19501-27508
MVSFLGDLSDLVSTVTSVAKEISKEVVSDVRVAVKTATAEGKENIPSKRRVQEKVEATKSSNNDITTGTTPSTTIKEEEKDPPPIPSSLDLHYVTDRLWVMPQPTVDAWTAKCYFDKHKHESAEHEDTADNKLPFEPTVVPHRNDVVVLAECLEQQQDYTVFNVTDVPAEDTIVRALQGRIVHCPWQSPSSPRSETPSLSALLEIIYTLHAYLTLRPNNHTAIIYCDNGKTRSALVVAAYLTFTRHSRTCRDGFCHFVQHTGMAATADDALELWNACPPSLHTFARNFDQTVIQWGEYRNPKPLLLRAIALQGIPVEDKPCLDIWDGHQRHVYSSHPELWTDLVDTSGGAYMVESLPLASPPPPSPSVLRPSPLLEEAQRTPLPEGDDDDDDNHLVSFHNNSNNTTPKNRHHHASKQQPPISPQSQWADEEGFYRVNVVLEGDFCLLCRFGGVHAGSDKDSTKILFRYANTTVGMGAGGPYELPPSQVDLMRRYAHCFDPDDFLCTLLVEAHWNVSEVFWQEKLNRPCQGLPPILQPDDIRSVQRGWHLFQQHSVLQPNEGDVRLLLQEHASLSTDMVKLCLQHANLDVSVARASLRSVVQGGDDSIMTKLWNILQPPPPPAPMLPLQQQSAQPDDGDLFLEETLNILDVLDSITFDDDDDGQDFSHIPNFDEFLPRRNKADGGAKKKTAESKASPDSPPLISRATGSHLQQQQQQQEPEPPLLFASPFIHNMPRQGEILSAFGDYYKDIHGEALADFEPYDATRPLVMGESLPQLPYVQLPDHDNQQLYSPMDDPANAAAVELLLQMDHPGISLKDLTNLLEESKDWNKPHPLPLLEEEKKSGDEEGVLVAIGKGLTRKSSDEKAGPSGQAPPLKDHPQFSKYFKRLRAGTSLEEVKEMMKKDGKDSTIADLDPEKSLSSQRPNMADQEAVIKTTPNAVENAQKALQEALLRKKQGPRVSVIIPKKGEGEDEDPDEALDPQAKLMAALAKSKASADDDKEEDRPLRTDPVYAKYFKMLKMGMSKEQIQHAMTRDEKDPTIIELDPERSLLAQRPPPKKEAVADPPLKDDPEYQKYFKMLLKLGMPKEQVAHAVQRDGKDPAVLDLDPEKSLKSQQPSGADDGPPLKEDEEYKKYFRMLNMGMAKEQVGHALQRDGKDPKILDLDPEKSLKSQQGDTGPALKDDPEYTKYFKMLNMGLPKDAVKNALERDGKDPSIMDLDPNKSVKSQLGGGDDGPPLKEDPEYVKYFKMLNMGLPKDAVKNALERDGKDPSIMDLDPNKSVKSQLGGGDDGPPLKEDPEHIKYFKMLNMGLPKDAVKNALARDGKDPAVMDLDPEKSVKFQLGGGCQEEEDTGTPLKDDPEYSKYFKMLNMGLPKDAVKNSLSRDGKDPAVMDLDPNKSVGFQMKKKKSGGGSASRRTPSKKKKKVRRKKIYWTPINEDQINKDSIWNLVKGSVAMDKLQYDVKEFEDLFTESADPADRKKNKRKKTDSSKQKKSVQVIDGKRSMNGGIILARMKVEYSIIAKSVDEMQHKKFDATQMKALKEFLPTVDERQGLKMYMKKGETDPAAKAQLYKDLSECEKYMYTMIDVPKAPEKFDCMLFRSQFKVRFEDLLDAITTVDTACDETRNSDRLRQMMAMILTLVNQINTGGESSGAAGFGLDALLKLNEAKAFDKKTSVLMYLAKLVRKNDESLLGFQEDLATVRHAENIILDSLASDIKTIKADLEAVHATAAEEAERLEKAGELKPFSLSDLKELKTSVYTIEGVSHFNKVDHHTGRTPMERFALNSQDALGQASKKIEILKKKYQSLLLYFGEDEKKASNEFFGVMRRFIEEFEKACDQVEKTEAARIKEEKRSAKRAEQERRRSSIKAGQAGGLPSKEAMANLAKMAAEKTGGKGKGSDKKGTKTSGIGGIAAMAAMAASKKTDSKPASGGGIAAMAAMAAKKKAPDGTAKAPGGLAAMAAMSAKKKTDKPSGGLAAMAAMSAKKKTGSATKPSGGLSAMAAMSAKKKTDSTTKPAGGLAAMAAMSAKKKPEATRSGGLAAMAAMSSKKKTDSTTKPAGGLAGMAAMSAKNKKDSTTKPSGGLAAMAAMSAKKKPEASRSGGLAAMAAQKKNEPTPAGGLAALAAKKKSTTTPPGGLAAMAAKSQPQRQKSGGLASLAAKNQPQRQQSGGLASLAAKSQPQRQQSGGLASLATKTQSQRQPSGGLAATPTKSSPARQKSLGAPSLGAKSSPSRQKSDVGSPTSGLSGGRIATMAAQSKTKEPVPSQKTLRAMKQLETSYNPDATSFVQENQGKPQPTTPSRVRSGGLAPMAAAKGTAGASSTGSTKANPAVRSRSGGLAAMAATKTASAKSTPPARGLAAMAASSKSSNKGAQSKATGPTTSSGGLAVMAAAAKSQKSGTAAASQSDSHRGKRKVYDEQGGLYGDKTTTTSPSFAAAPNATLFQLGSGGSHGRHHHHKEHVRQTPARNRTGGAIRVPPRKANEKPVGRQPISRSRSNVERMAAATSFPPAPTGQPVVFGNSKGTGTQGGSPTSANPFAPAAAKKKPNKRPPFR